MIRCGEVVIPPFFVLEIGLFLTLDIQVDIQSGYSLL